MQRRRCVSLYKTYTFCLRQVAAFCSTSCAQVRHSSSSVAAMLSHYRYPLHEPYHGKPIFVAFRYSHMLTNFRGFYPAGGSGRTMTGLGSLSSLQTDGTRNFKGLVLMVLKLSPMIFHLRTRSLPPWCPERIASIPWGNELHSSVIRPPKWILGSKWLSRDFDKRDTLLNGPR
jgi:hypothetical protein